MEQHNLWDFWTPKAIIYMAACRPQPVCQSFTSHPQYNEFRKSVNLTLLTVEDAQLLLRVRSCQFLATSPQIHPSHRIRLFSKSTLSTVCKHTIKSHKAVIPWSWQQHTGWTTGGTSGAVTKLVYETQEASLGFIVVGEVLYFFLSILLSFWISHVICSFVLTENSNFVCAYIK